MLIHTLRRSLSSSVPRQVSRRTLSTQGDNFLEGFGADRFDDHAMAQVLDSSTLEAFKRTRASGEKMDKGAANSLAEGMAKWAMSKGCMQYAHWFSPVRGANGLKHDAFIDYDYGGAGQQGGTMKDTVLNFGAAKLFYNETDGSSFPNGGTRVTHRAAAFMNWDTSSPPFVRNGTLYIPSGFVSHEGHSLDEKTILLRSQDAVNANGVRLLRALGDTTATKVVANVGWEQEFFVVDRELYNMRPDLVATGRTLIGAAASRGQQTDYNYFNKVPPVSRAFFDELQQQLWAAGVSMITFHNEVAPSQVEFCPIFKLTNIAADENTMAMEIMEDLSVQFDVKILNHEKPFAGINGSGKHCNWGVNTDTGINLLTPGKTEESQARFMTFVAALARSVHIYGDTMRVGVATAGNDHRLGAQEAPPAIMSLYTGDLMMAHIESIISGGDLPGYGAAQTDISFGTTGIPPVTANLEDRNRTAPFPFCGNRFEFRAVGSNQNIAFPLAILNTAYADSLCELADIVEGGKSARDAVAEIFNAHKAVIFNGNGYADEWQTEAAERGLANLRTSPDAYDTFNSEKNLKLFSKHGVMTEEETHARREILEEKYTADVEMEAVCLSKMVETGIIPALAKDLAQLEGTGLGNNRKELYQKVDIQSAALTAAIKGIEAADSPTHYCAQVVLPAMANLREACDAVEVVMDDCVNPFPTYEALLFKLQC
jgi:glutamine synthetase